MTVTLNALLHKIWNHRFEFIKYFVVGVTAFILDTGSLYLLKEKLDLAPVWAIALSQPFILGFVFLTNRTWSFGAKGTAHESQEQLLKFLALAGGNYLFSLGWMWVMHHELHLHYMLARVANIILAVAWNFLLYKYWVYRVAPVNKTLN